MKKYLNFISTCPVHNFNDSRIRLSKQLSKLKPALETFTQSL